MHPYKRPGYPTTLFTTPQAMKWAQLLGYTRQGPVSITGDEKRALGRLYGFTKEEPGPDKIMREAGADRNLFRHAESDGLRLVAWLAKYLEPGEDPVTFVIKMLAYEGIDVPAEDLAWAEGNEETPAQETTP